MNTEATTTDKSIDWEFRQFADLSTCHITKSDGLLLESLDPSLPLVAGYHPREHSVWMYIPEPQVWQDSGIRQELLDHGFSHEFCDLLEKIREAGIPYVYFDPDGPIIEGLPTFNW